MMKKYQFGKKMSEFRSYEQSGVSEEEILGIMKAISRSNKHLKSFNASLDQKLI